MPIAVTVQFVLQVVDGPGQGLFWVISNSTPHVAQVPDSSAKFTWSPCSGNSLYLLYSSSGGFQNPIILTNTGSGLLLQCFSVAGFCQAVSSAGTCTSSSAQTLSIIPTKGQSVGSTVEFGDIINFQEVFNSWLVGYGTFIGAQGIYSCDVRGSCGDIANFNPKVQILPTTYSPPPIIPVMPQPPTTIIIILKCKRCRRRYSH